MIRFKNLAWAFDDPSFVNSPPKMDVAHWIWSLNEQDFRLLQFWIFASDLKNMIKNLIKKYASNL